MNEEQDKRNELRSQRRTDMPKIGKKIMIFELKLLILRGFQDGVLAPYES